MNKLPQSMLELLQVVLGAYLVIAAFAFFCNVTSPDRLAVLAVLLIGLVIVLMLEGLAAGAIMLIQRRRR